MAVEMTKDDKKIRQPIVAVLGHVDHGKTLLLDSIRKSRVQHGEAGGITQHIGASFIPIETIRHICGPLMEKLNVDVTIPGLLFIDTPGHEAFITLRKRGGSAADIAILVIDINSGFQPQTEESLTFLKEYKTPFIVAATKVDRLPGWFPNKGECIMDSMKKQRDDVKVELDKKLYNLVIQLSERGFESERFDNIEDFTKKIAVVPCSGMTGEGVQELLMMLTGLAQQFLKEKLAVTDKGKGVVLEVKDLRGLGTTIDVIVYDGSVHKDDYIVIGGKEPQVTRIKALLKPKPLKELRVEKQFDQVNEVHAAAGIKIAAPSLENVTAGSPIVAVRDEVDIEAAKAEAQKDVEGVEFTKDVEGIIVKADTLGGLEAMIKMLKDGGIPVRKAEVGHVNKQDVMEGQNVKDDLKKVIFAFNVKTLAEAEELAKDLKITIFSNKIIYQIFEDYKEWRDKAKERELEEKLERAVRPVKVKILDGCIFRASKPCIVGVEVVAGYLKKGIQLKNKDGKVVGVVKEIQKEAQNIDNAEAKDKVAINMEEPIAGRHIFEKDVLVSNLTKDDRALLKEIYEKLNDDEKMLLDEI
jgi:translation initiation factor 5B